MNNYSLALNVQQRPEVLERVLRVARHRGFKIANLSMQLNSNNSTSIDMLVESEREIGLLTNQINKLIDVIDCRVLVSDPSAALVKQKG
ncbi:MULTISPECIES: acetolactate synthase 2 small subunit [Shewanella]|uniref:Acetolactate synthase 2 small subunit n=1 Tax=Shewanella fidelis TaxID=173509 RepID=A0AAW8NW90_9GAMM|nr:MULTISPECIES: acetolactate synthase 2 small subunit [Shewanella]MDR8526189.1 acetolactate synthase 2 small subunit [Shewanella fidelis]MDW4814048.1 acetolactate synthase 2 small subunit [Shewanella fidelis]MDW4818237.1 acetolactate synthase 2 small subunit [Shewanella fidelis]MDW4822355.1 acetolactate synthase 2 small subunit [Shewanella fidelis]MDW4826475.1 acetolactate synthase 2 small subunit [Shewanella fidelis]